MATAMLDMLLDFQKSAQAESFRTWQRWMNAAKVPQIARDVQVATTPHEVVYEEDSLKLLRYRSEHSIDFAEPVLVCFALVNRPYILDLQPNRSVIRQLLKRGFDVYLIDWGIPTAADRTLRLQDYVCGFMKNVADFVCSHSRSPKLNLLGYCMGGTMSTMYTALYPGAGQESDPDGRADRLQRRRKPVEHLDARRELRCRRAGRRVRQLPGFVSAIQLSSHEAGSELCRKIRWLRGEVG